MRFSIWCDIKSNGDQFWTLRWDLDTTHTVRQNGENHFSHAIWDVRSQTDEKRRKKTMKKTMAIDGGGGCRKVVMEHTTASTLHPFIQCGSIRKTLWMCGKCVCYFRKTQNETTTQRCFFFSFLANSYIYTVTEWTMSQDVPQSIQNTTIWYIGFVVHPIKILSTDFPNVLWCWKVCNDNKKIISMIRYRLLQPILYCLWQLYWQF